MKSEHTTDQAAFETLFEEEVIKVTFGIFNPEQEDFLVEVQPQAEPGHFRLKWVDDPGQALSWPSIALARQEMLRIGCKPVCEVFMIKETQSGYLCAPV